MINMAPAEGEGPELEDFAELVESHVEDWIGVIEGIVEEGENPNAAVETPEGRKLSMPIDVIWVKATEERPFHALVSLGGSAFPLPETDPPTHAEWVLLLPPEYDVTPDSDAVFLLQFLARLPFRMGAALLPGETFLNADESIADGEPEPLLAGTEFVGALVAEPYPLDVGGMQTELGNGSVMAFFGLHLLTEAETNFAADAGAEALAERLPLLGRSAIVDFGRASVV